MLHSLKENDSPPIEETDGLEWLVGRRLFAMVDNSPKNAVRINMRINKKKEEIYGKGGCIFRICRCILQACQGKKPQRKETP